MRRTALSIPFSALLALAAGPALADTAALATVAVEVTKVQPGKGTVYISLCTTEEFMRRCALRTKADAAADSVRASFEGVPPGRYALSAWQDIGDDMKMSRGLFGEPLEPTGVSNDATGTMGPPAFEDAAFDIAGGTVTKSFRLR